VSFLNSGYCSQWGYLAGGPFWGLARFHAVFVFLRHPTHGSALIDTGYSEHFFPASARFPGRLYRWLTPVHLDPRKNARAVLQAQGIDPDEVRLVFVSHFHGDHVAGLKLFPNATFVYRRESPEWLMKQGAWTQVRHAFLPGLLPDDFTARGQPIEESSFVPGQAPLQEFCTLDYWGDGSLLLVDLPGHALGHTGYVLTTAAEQLFYIVDATWFLDTLLAGRALPRLSRRIQQDYKSYVETQDRLRRLAAAGGPPLVACHCPKTQARVARTVT
jgi:glyoxylase-like metal-dependent hydrolase (beta-lactamase superfamily II)